MDQGTCSRVINPILYHEIEENWVCMFSVMTIMSHTHYGLVLCIRDSSDLQSLDMDEIGAEIVMPFVLEMEYWVDKYFEQMQGVVLNFPALDPHTSYDFEMLEFNRLHFSALDGTDSPHGTEGANQYIFVAPTDVQFEEFVVDSARFLN